MADDLQQPEMPVASVAPLTPDVPVQAIEQQSLLLPTRQTALPLSGWKIGFAAGISFALTISLIAGLVWVLRNGSDWMAQSAKQQMDAQQEAVAPKVRPEYAKEIRALADAMKNEKATLTGDPAAMKKTEEDLENRISSLSSEAQTVHEQQIATAMWDVHEGVMSCIENILYGGRPSTPASTCVAEMKSSDEIEKAVNTPYTKY